MLELINEIKSCVSNKLFRCALGMALTLPDICAQVEFPSEKNSQTRYVGWCENYLFNQDHYPSHKVDNSIPPAQWKKERVIEPQKCYKLRCALLHSGNLELNQREKDCYPVFNLQITSESDNGIYIGSIMKNESGELLEETIDVRLLINVLCNAAKDYYDKCLTKGAFNNHHIRIVDVEKEVKQYKDRTIAFEKLQSSKKDKKSYDELTIQAKVVLNMIQSGYKEEICNSLRDGNNDFLFALEELIEGGFI